MGLQRLIPHTLRHLKKLYYAKDAYTNILLTVGGIGVAALLAIVMFKLK
jgi:hypothetical protein